MIFVCVSTGHFDPLIEECDRLRNKFEFVGQIGMGYYEPRFRWHRTLPPPEIERFMAQAEVVVSHGGAGMTSQLYLMRKRCVIVPKQRRYGEANDLQVELAKKWAELGTGVLCLDVKDLEASILRARSEKFSYPEFPALGEQLRDTILASTANINR